MKYITAKNRSITVAAILAAVTLCLAFVTGFVANRTTRAAAEVSDSETVKVGISFPYSEYYYNLSENIKSQLHGNYNLHLSYYYDVIDQINDIENHANNHVDILIVAPINSDAIAYALWDAYDEGVHIIVIGEYNDNYPKGITYITQESYYDVGFGHAEWVCEDPSINDDSVIYVFYYNNYNGNLYRDGIRDGFDQRGIKDNVKYVDVESAQDAYDYMREWFDNNKNKEINELVTYASRVAEYILQSYYAEGYVDSSSGTGIRAFCDIPDAVSYSDDPEQDVSEYFAALGGTIAEAIEYIISGAVPPNATEIDGSYVIHYGFVPGYVKYVSRA